MLSPADYHLSSFLTAAAAKEPGEGRQNYNQNRHERGRPQVGRPRYLQRRGGPQGLRHYVSPRLVAHAPRNPATTTPRRSGLVSRYIRRRSASSAVIGPIVPGRYFLFRQPPGVMERLQRGNAGSPGQVGNDLRRCMSPLFYGRHRVLVSAGGQGQPPCGLISAVRSIQAAQPVDQFLPVRPCRHNYSPTFPLV